MNSSIFIKMEIFRSSSFNIEAKKDEEETKKIFIHFIHQRLSMKVLLLD